MGDENISPEHLSDTIFKPREQKRPFQSPNFHENTLAANFSGAWKSESDSSICQPTRPRKTLKEKDYNLTFNGSQSVDNSIVSVCSFRKNTCNTLKERFAIANPPNFNLEQSYNDSVSQFNNDSLIPPKSHFRFDVPSDLTFAVSFSEATSKESSQISSDYLNSSKQTNSDSHLFSFSGSNETKNSSSKVEFDLDLTADQSASQNTTREEIVEEEVLLEGISNERRINDTTVHDATSTDENSSQIASSTSHTSKLSESLGNNDENDVSTSNPSFPDENEHSSTSRHARFQNTGNTFIKNDTSNSFSEVPVITCDVTQNNSATTTEEDQMNKTTSAVNNISTTSEPKIQNNTYTITSNRESLSVIPEVILPGPIVRTSPLEISVPGENEEIERNVESSEHLSSSVHHDGQSVKPDVDSKSQDDCDAIKNAENVSLSGVLSETNSVMEIDLLSVSKSRDEAHTSNCNIRPSQESVIIANERKTHLEILKDRSCRIDFNEHQSQNDRTDYTLSQGIDDSKNFEILRANNKLNLLKDASYPVDFTGSQNLTTASSDTVFVERRRFQFKGAQENDFTFSGSTAHSSMICTPKTDSLMTCTNYSALVEEESVTISDQSENHDPSALTGLNSLTFEVVGSSKLEVESNVSSEILDDGNSSLSDGKNQDDTMTKNETSENVSQISNRDTCESQESEFLRNLPLPESKNHNYTITKNDSSEIMSQISNRDTCESQESVFLLKPELRRNHLQLLEERSCRIDFRDDPNEDVGFDNTHSQGESKKSIMTQEIEKKKSKLSLLKNKSYSINFSMDQSHDTTSNETVFAEQKRFQFDMARDVEITFSGSTSQSSVGTSQEDISSTTCNDSSDLVEENSISISDQSKNYEESISVNSCSATIENIMVSDEDRRSESQNKLDSVTFEIVESSKSRLEHNVSSKVSEIEISRVSENKDQNDESIEIPVSQPGISGDELLSQSKSTMEDDKQSEFDRNLPEVQDDSHSTAQGSNTSGLLRKILHDEMQNDTFVSRKLSDLQNRYSVQEISLENRTDVDEFVQLGVSSIMRKQDFTYSIVNTSNSDAEVNLACRTHEEISLANTVEHEHSQNDASKSSTMRKQDFTYSIVNTPSSETEVNLARKTHEENSPANTVDFEHSQRDASEAKVEKIPVDRTKNDVVDEIDDELAGAEAMAVSVAAASISLGESVKEMGASNSSHVEENQQIKSLENREASHQGIVPLTYPLDGHSYCKPTEMDTACESLGEQAKKSSELILANVSKSSPTSEKTHEKSCEPKRRSSRLQKKRSMEGSHHEERELRNSGISSTKCNRTKLAHDEDKDSSQTLEKSGATHVQFDVDYSAVEGELQSSKRKSSRLTNRETTQAEELLSNLEMSMNNTRCHASLKTDVEAKQWESGIDMLEEVPETEITPQQSTQMKGRELLFPGSGSSSSSNKSIENESQSDDIAPPVVLQTITPMLDTPILKRRSNRSSKRKSPDTDEQNNSEHLEEALSFVPEMAETMKNYGARKSARLSTKSRFSVRFADSVHSISTIDGPSTSRISLSGKSSVSRKSSATLSSGNSSNRTGSSNSSEPSLVNKLFAENDDGVFLRPTSAAPKKKKKSAQLLRFVDDTEVETLPKKPQFPRLADYIHPRFYEVLVEKMKPKYGIETNAKAVQLAEFIQAKVEEISWSKEHYPEDEVEQFKHVLARKQIVTTHYDFWMFCWKRLPEYFMKKAFPLFVVKNGKRQLRDCSNIHDPIME